MSERTTREVARLLCRAYELGTTDDVLTLMAPTIRFVPLSLVADRPYEGHEGIRRFFADAATEWESLRFTVHRIGVADRRAVLLGRYRAGRNGVLQDGRAAWVIDVVDGLVVRSVSHDTWEDALAEAGLELGDTEPLAV